MKKISVMVPCYNEVENIDAMSEAIVHIMEQELPNYDYELIFIDNCSQDGTRDKIEKICEEIIRELKNQKLVPRNMKSDFLQDYGLPIQQSIEDEQMKKWPPMVE